MLWNNFAAGLCERLWRGENEKALFLLYDLPEVLKALREELRRGFRGDITDLHILLRI